MSYRNPRAFSPVAAWAVTAALAALPLAAHAQNTIIDVQYFKPNPFFHGLFNIQTGDLLPENTTNYGFIFDYQNDPLILRSAGSGDYSRRIIAQQATGNILLGYGMTDWLNFGALIPIIFYQSGEGFDGQVIPKHTGIGDLRLVPTLKLWRTDDEAFALSLTGTMSFPTGHYIDPFMGAPSFVFYPQVNASYEYEKTYGAALNIGYKATKNEEAYDLEQSDEFALKLGIWWHLLPKELDLIGEAIATTQSASLYKARNATPVELIGGAKYFLREDLYLIGGMGAGVIAACCAPDFRMFIGVRYMMAPPAEPVCPEGPEDMDGFRDEDKCADPDNDQDGILDPWVKQQGLAEKFAAVGAGSDACPDDPEDKDGFEDEDGCPDPDNDKDGVCDPWVAAGGKTSTYAQTCQGSDACPDQPEDKNGIEDQDGCPDKNPDPDIDGVCSPWVAEAGKTVEFATLCKATDQCPDDPEDKDGFQDDDGCPDPDNDNDGICDPWVESGDLQSKYAATCKGNDQCPSAPETVNELDDTDGCPDQAKAKIEGNKIVIMDRVYFVSSKTIIIEKSYEVLNSVAQILIDNPQVRKVRIEGHTDTRGNPVWNKNLAAGRAQAVLDYLVNKGVDAARLTSEGFGEERPLVFPERTEEDLQTNRRVEFIILETKSE